MDPHLGPLIGLVTAFLSLALLVAYDGLKLRHRADLAMVVGILAWMADVFWHHHIERSGPDVIDAFVDHFNFQFCLAAGTGLVLLAIGGHARRVGIVWPLEAIGGGLLLSIWAADQQDPVWLLMWRLLSIVVGVIMLTALALWVVRQKSRRALIIGALSALVMLCGVGGVLWHDHFVPWAVTAFNIYPAVLVSLWWIASGRFAFVNISVAATEMQPMSTSVRERVAQEVHDGVGSQLTAILASLDPKDPVQRPLIVALEQCLIDLRITVDTLHDDADCSLPHALGMLRYRLQPCMDRVGTRLHWQVEDHPSLVRLPPSVAINCLRVAQEALANSVRHAHASEVSLTCSYHPASHHLELEVADNGVGMDVSGKATMSHGKGLRSIQKRVADLGGALDVQAKLGKGVKLTIAIPCDT